jgi:hypothetical protein
MSLNRNGFPSFVNKQPPVGILGGFASQNVRVTALAGEGAFRSGNGLNYLGNPNLASVGKFAYAAGAFAGAQKPAGASVVGFIANEDQANIPFNPSLANVNAVALDVNAGFPVTLFTRGDFWTIPQAPVSGIVSPGDTVYIRQYDGAPTNDGTSFSATGVQTAASSTLTVSAVTKGSLTPGMTITGSGVAANTVVVAQLTGTPGGAGTYTVSNTTGFSSTTISVAADDSGFKWQSSIAADSSFTGAIAAGTGVLTASAVTGTIAVGQYLNGTGVPANLFITAQLSGTAGGAGTYQTNTVGPAVSSVAMTSSEGKLAKISRTY